jgi:hypothetical protein
MFDIVLWRSIQPPPKFNPNCTKSIKDFAVAQLPNAEASLSADFADFAAVSPSLRI